MFKFDKQFFDKYQKGLLFVANSVYLRWILGLNRLPKDCLGLKIHKITENSIHSVVAKNGDELEVKAVFFTRNRFAEALAYNLSPFVYLENIRQTNRVWRFSPIGVFGCLVLFVLLKGHNGLALIGTTTTFYPDANPESTSVDGLVYQNYASGSGQPWSTINALSAGSTANDSATTGEPAQFNADTGTNNWRLIARGFYLFDTSSIGSSNTVSSATLSISSSSKVNSLTSGNTFAFNIYSSSPASNTAIVTGDFDQVGTTQFSTSITYASWSTAGYNDFALNASGISAVSKTGISKYGFREANYDAPATAPTWTNSGDLWVTCYFADQTGTSNDPKLVVTYAASGTTISVSVSSATANQNAYVIKAGAMIQAAVVSSVGNIISPTVLAKAKAVVSVASSLANAISPIVRVAGQWNNVSKTISSWVESAKNLTNWTNQLK